MTRNETRAAILIMEAYLDGYEIQRCGKHWNPKESLKPDWCDTDEPSWDFDNCDYRIKPTAKLRPWTADEVPVGAILRYKGNPQSLRILIVSSLERGLAGYETNWPYQALLQEMEHSTDGGKTWLPCGVVEEAK
jgi:hypothetical protein